MKVLRPLIALLSLFAVLQLVGAKTITQIVCSDPACSQNCGATAYEQGACYSTLQSGSTVQMYCQSEDTVINQVFYPESTDCSGFNYDYPVSAESCAAGQYDYVEYICGSLADGKRSADGSRRVRNVTQPRPVDAAPFVVRPAPDSVWRTKKGRVGRVRAKGPILVIPSDALPKGLRLADLASADLFLNITFSRAGADNKRLRAVPIPFHQLIELGGEYQFGVYVNELKRFIPSIPKDARFNRGKESRRSTIFVSVLSGAPKEEGKILFTLTLPAPLANLRR